MKIWIDASFVAITLIASTMCHAQSTSLYLDPPTGQAAPSRPQIAPPGDDDGATPRPVIVNPAATADSAQQAANGQGFTVAPAPASQMRDMDKPRIAASLEATSLMAVKLPPPRAFSKQDLVTIIISERVEDSADSSLETTKESELKGEVKDFPNLDLKKLLDLQLGPTALATPRKVDLSLEKEYSGEGQQKNRNTFTARLTSRIIDVKPNGTLILEARKHIRVDDESFTMIVTGTARPTDVTADNTVLSTQLADLRVTKAHDGEIKKSKTKGWITKVLDWVFHF